MSGAAIVVEIAQADAASPHASALVRACTEGLRAGGDCVLANEAGAVPAAVVAVVSWDGPGHLSARVQVGARGSLRSDWFTSELRFASWDAEVERWRAVGLVIATLAAGAISPRATLEPSPVPPRRPAASTVERASPAQHVPRASLDAAPWSFELGLHVANGAADGFGARGGSLRAERRIVPSLFATASVRYDVQPETNGLADLEWVWISAGVGAATSQKEVPFVFEARLEPLVGWVRASFADGVAQGAAASGYLFGARQGVAATWWALDWLGISLDAELSETTRRTVLRTSLAGGPTEPVAIVSQLGWSTGIGVRLGVR